MIHLGLLKIVIETHNKCENYSILLFDEGERKGYLKYYNKGEEVEEFDSDGWKELGLKLMKLAEQKCIELNGVLWSY